MEEANKVKTDQFNRIQGATLKIGEKIYPVYKGINTVGRNKFAVINVKHLNVSQNQAIITIVDNNQHFISDLNSSNGTFLHGVKLVPFKLYELTNDVNIEFGDIVGTYFKVSDINSTLNLTETAEMTQNMTQNFYSSNTQLIFEKSVTSQSNEHSYSRSSRQVIHSQIPKDIHEMETEVLDFSIQNTGLSTLKVKSDIEECVLEEQVDTGIHDAPTQVFNFHDAPTQVVNFSKQEENDNFLFNKNQEELLTLNDIETTRNSNTNSKDSGSESTEILNKAETQRDVKGTDDNRSSGSDEATQILDENKSQEEIEATKKNSEYVSKQRNVLHWSQTPCSSGLNINYPTTEVDDSFVTTSKPDVSTFQEDIEETVIEENSNDSMDFLTMQKHDEIEENSEDIAAENESRNEVTKTNSNKDCSQNSMTVKLGNDSSESEISTGGQRKPIRKLAFDTDSETEIDDSEDICTKKKQSEKPDSHTSGLLSTRSRKKINKTRRLDDSDSDTDIEGTQDIGFKKKPVRKLNSDDDLTQSTNEPRNESLSGSETDYEDEIKVKESFNHLESEEQNREAGSDHEAGKKNDDFAESDNLNDTDCIPATQDAFAEAFHYSNQKTQKSTQSSEESFKLGITELLEDSAENAADDEHKLNDEEIQNKGGSNDRKQDDSIYILPTQKICDKLNPAATTTALGVSKKDDAIFFMATQKINDSHPLASNKIDEVHSQDKQTAEKSQTDYLFLQPTQSISFEKLDVIPTEDNERENVSGTGTQKMCSESSGTHKDEDIYLQATQKIGGMQENNENTVFLLPTQTLEFERDLKYNKIDEDKVEPAELATASKEVDDIYFQATQKLVENQTDSVFLQPTQTLEFERQYKRGPKKYNKGDKAKLKTANKDVDDIYIQATQKLVETQENQTDSVFLQPTQSINVEVPYKPVPVKDIEDDENIYAACTQQIDNSDTIRKTNENGSNLNHTDVCNPEVQEKPNETTEILGKTKSIEDIAENSTSPGNVYDVPSQDTDTQSEMLFTNDNMTLAPTRDINRPENPLIHVLNEESTSEETEENNAGAVSSITKRARDLQTDILESPVKKMRASPKESKSDDVQTTIETMSQIEAFIKKPLDIAPLKTKERRPEVRKEPIVQENDVETLSQIEAFIKKPLIVPKRRKSVRNKKKEAEEAEMPETLSQIEAFVKKPFPKLDRSAEELTKTGHKSVTDHELKDDQRVPTISSKQEETKATYDKLDMIKEYNEADDFEDSTASKTLRGKMNLIHSKTESKANEGENPENHSADVSRDQEVKSDVDQSFALLESESTKVRRQPQKRQVLNEIKVATTAHRRSMTIAEISKVSLLEEYLPSRRSSRKVTINNNNTSKSCRTKRKAEKTTKTKKKSNVADSESDVSDHEVSSKILRSSKLYENTSEASSKESCVTSASSGISDTHLKKRKNVRITNVLSTSEESDTVNERSNTLKQKTKRASTPSPSGMSDEMNKPSTSLKHKKKDAMESSISNKSLATPKRGQKSMSSESLLNSAERSKRKQRPKVVFTMMESPQLESFIRQLGGSIVDCVDSCTVLVTEHVKRSQKLLTAVAQGKPICSPNWIQASKKANEFLDPWDYILIDEEAESKWKFSLKESIIRAETEKLLTNYTFQLMVSNAADVLKGAIVASGGKCVSRNPGNKSEGTFVVVASPEFKTKYMRINKQNPDITIIEPEAIFDGVLRQELRFSRHLLS